MGIRFRRIVLALSAGALAGGGLALWLRGARQAAIAEPMGIVVVVKKRIAAAERVSLDRLAVETRPRRYIPPDATPGVGETVGRRARRDLLPGEVLAEDKLLARSAGGRAPLAIPAGRRAVALAVDEVVGVAGFVEPGSMVDVIAVLAIGGLPVSRLVLQNVEVLAVAQDPARRPDGERKARVSSSVTLAVTPEEAEKLVLATERGKIRLALRSQGETSLVRTQGYSPESLGGPRSGGAAAAAPARLRPAPPPPRPVRKPRARPAPVEIIKGNKVERIEP